MTELDGLRGFAALSVFLSHAVGLLYESSVVTALQSSPIRIFWDGAAAVDLFFVLSGFVLSLPYVVSSTSLNYLDFGVRRIFRLYPAFWAALIASLAFRAAYSPAGMAGLSEWAQSLWTYPIDAETLLRHIPLVIHVNSRAIDPVIWSLLIEMRMSLLLPAVILAFNLSDRVIVDLMILVVSLALAALFTQLAFFPLFVLGVVAAKHFAALRRQLQRTSPVGRLGLLVGAGILYGNRWVFLSGTPIEQDVISGLGSLAIILCVSSFSILKSFFSSRVSRFMGDTSYSFYLLHLPLLILITSRIYPLTNSILTCCVLSAASAYLLAFLSFRLVELPAIQFGRRVRWGPTLSLEKPRAPD